MLHAMKKHKLETDYVHLVPIITGSKKKSENYVPIQFLTDQHVIDFTKILHPTYKTCIGKLLQLTQNKSSYLLDQIKQDLSDGEIQLTLINKHGHRSLSTCNISKLESYVKTNRHHGTQTHEFVTGENPIRFFMDIDSTRPIILDELIERIKKQAKSVFSDQWLKPAVYVCESNIQKPNKYSFHIFGNFGFSNMAQCKYFVKQLQWTSFELDLSVYTKNHAFRLCYSGKGGDNARFHIPPENIDF